MCLASYAVSLSHFLFFKMRFNINENHKHFTHTHRYVYTYQLCVIQFKRCEMDLIYVCLCRSLSLPLSSCVYVHCKLETQTHCVNVCSEFAVDQPKETTDARHICNTQIYRDTHPIQRIYTSCVIQHTDNNDISAQ